MGLAETVGTSPGVRNGTAGVLPRSLHALGAAASQEEVPALQPAMPMAQAAWTGASPTQAAGAVARKRLREVADQERSQSGPQGSAGHHRQLRTGSAAARPSDQADGEDAPQRGGGGVGGSGDLAAAAFVDGADGFGAGGRSDARSGSGHVKAGSTGVGNTGAESTATSASAASLENPATADSGPPPIVLRKSYLAAPINVNRDLVKKLLGSDIAASITGRPGFPVVPEADGAPVAGSNYARAALQARRALGGKEYKPAGLRSYGEEGHGQWGLFQLGYWLRSQNAAPGDRLVLAVQEAAEGAGGAADAGAHDPGTDATRGPNSGPTLTVRLQRAARHRVEGAAASAGAGPSTRGRRVEGRGRMEAAAAARAGTAAEATPETSGDAAAGPGDAGGRRIGRSGWRRVAPQGLRPSSAAPHTAASAATAAAAGATVEGQAAVGDCMGVSRSCGWGNRMGRFPAGQGGSPGATPRTPGSSSAPAAAAELSGGAPRGAPAAAPAGAGRRSPAQPRHPPQKDDAAAAAAAPLRRNIHTRTAGAAWVPSPPPAGREPSRLAQPQQPPPSASRQVPAPVACDDAVTAAQATLRREAPPHGVGRGKRASAAGGTAAGTREPAVIVISDSGSDRESAGVEDGGAGGPLHAKKRKRAVKQQHSLPAQGGVQACGLQPQQPQQQEQQQHQAGASSGAGVAKGVSWVAGPTPAAAPRPGAGIPACRRPLRPLDPGVKEFDEAMGAVIELMEEVSLGAEEACDTCSAIDRLAAIDREFLKYMYRSLCFMVKMGNLEKIRQAYALIRAHAASMASQPVQRGEAVETDSGGRGAGSRRRPHPKEEGRLGADGKRQRV